MRMQLTELAIRKLPYTETGQKRYWDTLTPGMGVIVGKRTKTYVVISWIINAARKGTKWKPLDYRAIAIKTSHLSLIDLRDFEKDCRNANCYSAYFFWALKA